MRIPREALATDLKSAVRVILPEVELGAGPATPLRACRWCGRPPRSDARGPGNLGYALGMQVQTMRALLLLLVALQGVAVATPAPPAQTTPPAGRPNIVLIVADDVGWTDLGVYGRSGTSIPRPNLLGRARPSFWVLNEKDVYSTAPYRTARGRRLQGTRTAGPDTAQS
jgi:hypothetical protein